MSLQDYIHRWIRADPVRFHSLHNDMISARMGLTLEQYLWRAIRVSVVTGILFAVIGYFASSFISLQMLTGKAGITNATKAATPRITKATKFLSYHGIFPMMSAPIQTAAPAIAA